MVHVVCCAASSVLRRAARPPPSADALIDAGADGDSESPLRPPAFEGARDARPDGSAPGQPVELRRLLRSCALEPSGVVCFQVVSAASETPRGAGSGLRASDGAS